MRPERDGWKSSSNTRGTASVSRLSAARLLVLPDPSLDQLLDQMHGHRLVQRKAVSALAGHVTLQLFVLVRLTHRIDPDVVLESREVDQASLVVIVRHPVTDALLRFRCDILDQLPKPAESGLRRLRSSRNVRLDRFLAILFAHFFV